MRSYVTYLFFIFLLSQTNLLAQQPGDELDPFMGSYILGNSAELVIQHAPTSGTHSRWIYDFKNNVTSIIEEFNESYVDTFQIAGNRSMDVATGDLDGDTYDDIISAWECGNSSIAISITDLQRDSLHWINDRITIVDSVLHSSIRLITGDFDRDYQKEFILAYHGLDEVVLINPIATDYIGNLIMGENIYRLRSMVKVYDYNPFTNEFISKKSNEISIINNPDISGTLLFPPKSQVSNVVISTGNFDSDGQDEVVYGYEIDYWYNKPGGFVPSYHTYICNSISNFEIDASLDTITYDDTRLGHVGTWVHRDYSKYYLSGFSMSVCTHDLNRDGLDEVVAYGSRDLSVFETGENISFQEVGHAPAYSKHGFTSHHMLGVADLNADTTEIDSGKWTPEIVLVDFVNDPLYDLNNPHLARIWVYRPMIDTTGQITGISSPAMLTTELNGADMPSCVIALGDFNGDAVRMGKPRLYAKTSVIQPTVILNAPPVHYDIINNIPYDICRSYNENEPEFISSYIFTTSAEKQVESEIHSDWGISASLSAEGSFLGFGAKATLTAKYGEGFSKSEMNRHSTVIEQECNASVDDEIYATVTDYSFWEYPVYFKGKHYGYVMAAVPYLRGNTWFPSKSWTGISYIPNHETGNILSYPFYSNVIDNPGLSQLIWDFGSDEIHATSNRTETLTNTQFTSSGAQTSWDFGMSINASVWGWGFSLSTEAHYNMGEINTHKTSISEQFAIRINSDNIDAGIGEVNYSIRPYAYWADNGALVVDYNVEPQEAPPGQPVTWWQNNYGELSDPALILPWLYDPEKGYTLEDETKRYLTREIIFYPADPQQDDTVKIQARIHNYSLVDTDGPVTVSFYRGDPDEGGTILTSIYGETKFATPDFIKSRGEAYVEMAWQIPADIREHTRIYMLIDPDHAINEVHENNNKGFVVLSLPWAPAVGIISTPYDSQTPIILHQNYPNPFCASTAIRFNLSKPGHVKIDVINMLGQHIRTILNQPMNSGIHTVEFHAGNLAEGIYYYKIETRGSVLTRSMVLMK